MNAPDRDEEFAAFLKRRTLLPELPHQPEKLEPPAELDERVLSQARAAIHAQRQPVRVARWARPVALAATILLCLSIVLNITLNTRHPAATPPRATAAGTDKAARQAPATQGSRAYSADTMAQPAAPPLMAGNGNSRSIAPWPPGTTAQSTSHAGRAVDPAAAEEIQKPESAAAVAESVQPPQRAGTTGAPPALAKRKSNALPPHPQDPDAWLKQIEALRSQGKTAQADAEMQRFRVAFPDYPAPPADSGSR